MKFEFLANSLVPPFDLHQLHFDVLSVSIIRNKGDSFISVSLLFKDGSKESFLISTNEFCFYGEN